MKILVDTCIFEHSLAFRGGRQGLGVQFWGGKIPVETGGMITKYAGKTIKPSKGGDQNGALGVLAVALCEPNNELKGYTTDALQFETWNLKGSKFKETKFGDVQLFKNVELDKIQTLDGFSFQIPGDDVSLKMREFLGIQKSPLFQKILKCLNEIKLSEKSCQDAWHIKCMLEYEIDIFLTTDTKLIGQIQSFTDRKFRKMLLSRIQLPNDACARIGLTPLDDNELTELAKQLGAIPAFGEVNK